MRPAVSVLRARLGHARACVQGSALCPRPLGARPRRCPACVSPPASPCASGHGRAGISLACWNPGRVARLRAGLARLRWSSALGSALVSRARAGLRWALVRALGRLRASSLACVSVDGRACLSLACWNRSRAGACSRSPACEHVQLVGQRAGKGSFSARAAAARAGLVTGLGHFLAGARRVAATLGFFGRFPSRYGGGRSPSCGLRGSRSPGLGAPGASSMLDSGRGLGPTRAPRSGRLDALVSPRRSRSRSPAARSALRWGSRSWGSARS